MKTKVFFPNKLYVNLLIAIIIITSNPVFGDVYPDNDTALANKFFDSAKFSVEKGQIDSAIYYYKNAADIFNKQGVKEKYTACLNYISEQNIQLGKFVEARNYADQALSEAQENDLKHEIGKSYNNLGAIHAQTGEYDSAIIYFEKALEIWLPIDGEKHLRIAVIYTNLGYMYQIPGDYSQASEYSEQAIKILNSLDEDVDEYLAYNYNNLGAIYTSKGMYVEALNYFKLSLDMWESTYGESHPAMSSFYINIGEIYRKNGDFDQALIYFEKALSIFLNLGVELHQNVATCYTNIGTIYVETGQFKKALDNYEKAIKVWSELNDQHQNIATIYNNISSLYMDQQDYSMAIQNLNKAISILKSKFPGYHPELAVYYTNLGNNLSMKGDYKNAMEAFEQAIEINIALFGDKSPSLAGCYSLIGRMFIKQKDFYKALNYLQLGIISNALDFEDDNFFSNPSLKNILSKKMLLNSLDDKAIALYEIFRSKPDSVIYLKTALQTADLAIKLIDEMRLEFKRDNSKFFLKRQFGNFYKQAILYSIKLYKLTNDMSYFEKSFQIAEKNRSSVLFSSIIDIDARIIAGVPDSLQSLSRKLKHDISFYDKKIKDEKALAVPDNNRINLWQNIYFNSVRSYDSLVSDFEINYPSYYELKYNTNVANIEDIQSALENDEIMIEYMLLDTTLVEYIISKDTAEYFLVDVTTDFSDKIGEFRDFVINKGTREKSITKYKELAKVLYYDLLHPFEEILSDKSLIIIPDGKLALIPFEALLLPDENMEASGYCDLSYLIRKHPVSYSFSASLYLNSINKRNIKSAKNLLAFAPVFNSGNDDLLAEFRDRENNVISLPGTKEEITRISKVFNGNIFLEAEASESTFKDIAHDYRLIHLATHGIVDDIEPLSSRLLFSDIDDTLEDGALYAYELYNMKLNADLAVLSACNTGYGKMQEGEGVMSIARAFHYSGVPGVIMSLWSVNDKATTEIMVSFYDNLNKGFSKSKALQMAKLSYLEKSDNITAQPYYWAGFSVYGDNRYLDKKKHSGYWWLLVIPAILVLLFVRRKFFN